MKPTYEANVIRVNGRRYIQIVKNECIFMTLPLGQAREVAEMILDAEERERWGV